ncbi:hypothetical protein SBRY_100056 [Actinacidiphila bryophytorum]|uniref:Uncharacterized protein n=1 Tax=Actinacidiphila bryophytorum TaxID=1436133 RepID=A0A9W4E4X0_9ACTN|nr:hypothetical protein SBRY_100056 [Actinacidiphila bryophytorum]
MHERRALQRHHGVGHPRQRLLALRRQPPPLRQQRQRQGGLQRRTEHAERRRHDLVADLAHHPAEQRRYQGDQGRRLRTLRRRAQLHDHGRHPGAAVGLQRAGQPAVDRHLGRRADDRGRQVPGRRRNRQRRQGADLLLLGRRQPEVARQLRRNHRRGPVRAVPGRDGRRHRQRDADRAVVLQRGRQPEVELKRPQGSRS